MIRSLRIKFVLTIMVIVTVMLSLIFGILFHFTKISMERSTEQMMTEVLRDPFSRRIPGGTDGRAHSPYFIVQITALGDIIAYGDSDFDLSDTDVLTRLIGDALDADDYSGRLDEYNLRFRRVSRLGYELMVFADTTGERETLRSLTRICGVIGAGSLLLFLALSLLLSHWAVKPVDEAWKQQRQFVADASHELKTPLTVIMTNAELLQSAEPGSEEISRSSAGILTMARQMRELVERLLELARADNEQNLPVHAPVELSRVAENTMLPFEAVLFEQELLLESEIEPGICVYGAEAQLRQVEEILLDNARKYSDRPGTVRVELHRAPRGHCRLTVSNPGEPIPVGEREKIFKRFYRTDEARSRDGSFGLGLSIADSILRQHKGKIWVECREGRNIFIAELPCSVQ